MSPNRAIPDAVRGLAPFEVRPESSQRAGTGSTSSDAALTPSPRRPLLTGRESLMCETFRSTGTPQKRGSTVTVNVSIPASLMARLDRWRFGSGAVRPFVMSHLVQCAIEDHLARSVERERWENAG